MHRALLAVALATFAAQTGYAQTVGSEPVEIQLPFGEPKSDRQATAWFAQAQKIQQFAFSLGFKGEIAIDMGDLQMSIAVSPDMEREGYVPLVGESALWPYASVTKQILAARLLGELAIENTSLDTPISRFVPGISRRGGRVPTIRELLQHRSGLRNPEDTPKEENGWPAFYNNPDEYGLDWCLRGRSAPPKTGWSYNNCDYIVLGAAFDELSYESVEYMLAGQEGIVFEEGDDEGRKLVERAFIRPENTGQFYAMRSPESEVLPGYGASGALGGTLQDMIFFNWNVMYKYGQPDDPMVEMWKGDPALGFMSLGQWVFETQPQGCDAPVVVAERKGEIGQYRMHNIMLPELKRSMVLATVDPKFEFGEIWAGEGFMAKAVAMLACGVPS
ncbi:MAG: serine hydrolase [Erythrobacter sp.]|nr:serine hydrolase [Erythrobacter sp.]